jgi:hypothetical protein
MGTYRHAGDNGTAEKEENSRPYGEPKVLTPLQLYYLRQLERLISQRQAYQADPQREEWLLKAINNAAYSAFRSCLELGVEAEAKALLEQESA